MKNLFLGKLQDKYFIASLVALKLCGVAFATLVFAKFTPLVDSNLYLQGYYEFDQALRTRIIHYMAVFLNGFGGVYFAHSIFALISVLGLIYYFLIGGRRWLCLFFLLLPSSFVWTSIVGKEAIYFGFTGLLLVIWVKYVICDLNFIDVALVIISLIICALLRPHYTIALVWILFATAIIKKFKRYAFHILFVVFLIGILLAYITIWDDLLRRGFTATDPLARATRTIQMAIVPSTEIGFQRFKELVFWGLIYGIIGPLPSEVIQRIEFLPFFVEGLFILISPFLLLFLTCNIHDLSRVQFFKFFCWCLVPAMIILMIVHAPFGLLNPGSATRWRTNFDQVFYLAPTLLFFAFMDHE